MCYRNFPHSEVNTTGHIESFHNRLKRVYLKRKVNKRLDDLVTHLFDIEWDDHCTRTREATIGFSSQPQHIAERHQRGLLMPDEHITEHAMENTWELKSATGKSSTYIVVRYKETCDLDFCFSKCLKPECHGLCAHLSSCSCPDHHPLCKHIHKLQSFLARGQPGIVIEEEDFYVLPNHKTHENMISEESESHSQECNDTNSASHLHEKKWQTMIVRLQTNISLVENFITAAQQKQVPEHSRTRVDAVIADLVTDFGQIELNNNSGIESIPIMPPVIKFTPNEKLLTQVSQLLPFKRPPKRKHNADDPATLAGKKKAAKESLLEFAPQSSDSEREDDLDSNPIEYSISNSYRCFTVSMNFSDDLFDIVLHSGEERISLMDLKTLELMLPEDQEMFCVQRDPTFKVGFLSAPIMNSFLYKLSQCHEFIWISSEFAGSCNVDRLKAKVTNAGTSNVIILPVKTLEKSWCVVSVAIQQKEVSFYDPLQMPLSLNNVSILTQLVSDLKVLFPSVTQWKIKVIRLPKVSENDSGPAACMFCKQAVQEVPLSILHSSYESRMEIYNTIVGNCLRRSHFCQEVCGKCHILYENDNSADLWVSCLQCQQWFHLSCISSSIGYSAGTKPEPK
ncbi:Chromatin remodeling protein SHL [Frankliniella fusca]|uniref:Chromatin remodeling protein SHL n=1 Tax=Frankliniella fusca TaxID=407009 RepID=A0AAE1LT24_9NEOP|nr:Chromatin remodeling protein SHL [Frankliniella fusca]